MSTSRNWAIWVHEYLEEFPGKEDVLRYVLCANMPETKDSEFTWRDFQSRNNNELVAILGNFVNRVFVLTHKYFDGKIPGHHASLLSENYIAEFKQQIQRIVDEEYIPAIEHYRFRDGLAAMMDVVRLGNKFLTDFEPWKLIKTDPGKTGGVLRICLESLVDIAILAEPFLPFSSNKIISRLNLTIDLSDFSLLSDKLTTGNSLGEPFYLFEKIDDALIEKKLNELEAIRNAGTEKTEVETKKSTTVPVMPNILYEDFAKLDMRTGVILEAEKIEGADKLLKLSVDIGSEKRIIVSGIAKHFLPEQIIGKKVIVLVNLLPRKMKGVESNGMILMAEDENGKLIFINKDGGPDPGLRIS